MSFFSGIFKKKSNKVQRDSQDKLRINIEDLTNEPPETTKIFGKPLLEAVLISPDYLPPPNDFPHSNVSSLSGCQQKISNSTVSTITHTQATILRSYIPIVVRRCIDYLNTYCLNEEGLYRIPGNKKKVQIYQRRFDFGEDLDFTKELEKEDVKYIEPHDVAALLLTYLKELKHYQLFDETASELLLKAKWQEMQDEDKIDLIKHALTLMPQENLETLRYLIEHLLKVAENSEKNQMTKRNLIICICGMSQFAPVFYNLLNFPEKTIFENEKLVSVRKLLAENLQKKIENEKNELLNEIEKKEQFNSIENMALPQLPDDFEDGEQNNDNFEFDEINEEKEKKRKNIEKRRGIRHNESISSASSNSDDIYEAAIAAEKEEAENFKNDKKLLQINLNQNPQLKKRNSVNLLISSSFPSDFEITKNEKPLEKKGNSRLFPHDDLKKLFRQNSLQILLASPSNSSAKQNSNFSFSEKIEKITADENALEAMEENFVIINSYLKNELESSQNNARNEKTEGNNEKETKEEDKNN